MIRRPPRSTLSSSSAASDVYKRQVSTQSTGPTLGATLTLDLPTPVLVALVLALVVPFLLQLQEMAKLQAVYDSIDNGNHKQAIKLCDQILKKSKQPVPLVLSLKAVALDRVDRRDEALLLCNQIMTENPELVDESTLSTTLLVLKSNQQEHLGTLMYERAFAKQPDNENFGVQVFNGHLRDDNYPKQQQVARKLFKQFKNNRYFKWSIASMHSQALASPEESRLKQLSLVEMMLAKAESDGQLEGIDDQLLYKQVLEDQGKFELALERLPSDTSSIGDNGEWELQQMRALLLVQMGEKQQAREIYEQLFEEGNADNWDFLQAWMQIVMELEPEGWEATVTEKCEYLDQLVGQKKRGPLLLKIEVAVKQLEQNGVEPLLLELVRYYRRFGSKGCCGLDLRVYLAQVPEQSRPLLFEMLTAELEAIKAESEAEAEADELNVLRLRVTLVSLQSLLGTWMVDLSNMEAVMGKVDELVEEYHSFSGLNQGLESSERGHNDLFLTLAASLLSERWEQHRCKSSLQRALALLTEAVERSSSNFEFKANLLRLYCQAGSPATAYEIFKKLSVKHIQFESISHEVFEPLVSSLLLPQLRELCDNIKSFHRHALKDVPDMIAGCYRHSKYHKLAEFYSLRHRLTHGAAKWNAALVGALDQLSQGQGVGEGGWESLCSASLINNDDTHAVPDWTRLTSIPDPPSQRGKPQSLSPERQLLVEQRLGAVRVASAMVSEDTQAAQMLVESQQLDSVVACVLSSSLSIGSASDDMMASEHLANGIQMIEASTAQLCASIDAFSSELLAPGLFDGASSLLLETLPTCLACMHRWQKDLKPPKGKGKNKTESNKPTLAAAKQWHTVLSSSLNTVASSAKAFLKRLKNISSHCDDKFSQAVLENIKSSHEQSAKAIVDLATHHLAALKKLKL
eukprot:TRINITY_DN13300_c0_g2_i1.p1 TRINITY_DN13300_c0_g2~~TRINITY_DN13300_c0_g2_i1.p1  ORF type:complete len:916 (-),score=272.12 TRINITY_DN13300_c0_g2_i1:266-3013(-)